MNIQVPNTMHPHDSYLVEGLKAFLEEIDSEVFGFDLKDVTIVVSDANGWICETFVGFNTIRINLKVLQVIYAYCYAYYTFYNKVCKGVKPNGQYIEMAGQPDLTIVRSMLTWATNNLTAKIDTNYYDDTSFPILSTDQVDFIFQLYVGAVSFYIMHEVMHLALGQEPSIEEEKQCDFNATAFLLNINRNGKETNAKGVAVGLTLINALGMHTGNYDGTTHPFAYDRLLNCLTKHCDHDSDSVWDWIVALFALHMTENRIPQPKEEFDNFYDCVVKYRNILDEHRQNVNQPNSDTIP